MLFDCDCLSFVLQFVAYGLHCISCFGFALILCLGGCLVGF